MKITILGSSHGLPEPNRRCSSALIEVGTGRYIIDMGTQVEECLVTKGIPVPSINGVFITHMHGDHTSGLLSYLNLCTWYYKTADPVVFLPGDMESTIAAIGAWIECNGHQMRPFRFSQIQEGQIYEDENIRVTAFKTKHRNPSYAFLVEGEGKRVLFSGDLSHRGPQEDFPMSVLDVPLDLAICECTHFNADLYMPLFEGNTNLKRLCINHYCDVRLGTVLQLQKDLTTCEVIRANDDMVLDV